MDKSQFEDLSRQLRSPMPKVPHDPVVGDMDPWRDRIDAIDRLVILLLNERAVCATHIGTIKKHHGLSVYTPAREDEVLRNVMASNPGPLTDQAVRRLYERIIDETRSLERHLYAEE
ncbi:MAG TPA: chorismate mutase [Rhodothermales bacterium]|nr:chorismate mutase [Rhodothermales bacterium]